MKISYNWLQKYFKEPLPSPTELSDELTFHSWEVDEIVPIPESDDTMLDVKVLPDKGAWALSHRGVAKDTAAVLGRTLAHDPLADTRELDVSGEGGGSVSVVIDEDSSCDRYAIAHIKGVTVALSPKWLKDALEAVGQRSINNIVDATNYILLGLGQPTHVFDAQKMSGVRVRVAEEGEEIALLGDETRTLSPLDTVIADAETNTPLAIGGVKGGIVAELSEDTSEVYVECAHFDAVRTRKTAQRLNLRTDASARYENGIVPEMVPFGLRACVELIIELAGGSCTSVIDLVHTAPRAVEPVTCSFEKLDSVLGFSIPKNAVADIFTRLGYVYEETADAFTIVPPFERTDLSISEDLVEEVIRFYGLEHVPEKIPKKIPLTEVNAHFYYAEKVRHILAAQGFSEIYTSTFRKKDDVKLKNALASDKGCLRSTLRKNMEDALQKNAPNIDLLGVGEVRIFEIGHVFTEDREYTSLAIGVWTRSGYKQKVCDRIIEAARDTLGNALGVVIEGDIQNGVLEINLDALIEKLPKPTAYDTPTPVPSVMYTPFATQPSISRDIAMWVTDTISPEEVEKVLRIEAGEYCVRSMLVDTFAKDGRTSYAFRFVFQATDRTLTDAEVNEDMDRVYSKAESQNWETR